MGVATSPYCYVYGERDWLFTCELSEPAEDFELFRDLRSDGLTHYACVQLMTPATQIPAVMSIASNQPFPEDLRPRLASLRGLLGLACYAACRTSQAREIATCYVGTNTGPKVLEGHMVR